MRSNRRSIHYAAPRGKTTQSRVGSTSVIALLESPRLFLATLLLLIFALMAWASVAHIDQVIRVEGKIIPTGRNQEVQHLEGGIVASIHATEGASVKQGDLLLTIDNTAAGTSLGETQAKLNAQRVRVARLEAEAKIKPSFELPSDLATLPTAKAESSLFQSQRSKLEQEVQIHQNIIAQRNADMAEANQRRARLSDELTTADQRLKMLLGMAAKGAASKLEVLDAQSRKDRLKTEIGEVEGLMPRLRASFAEEQSRIETLRADFRAQAHNELTAALAEIDRLNQNLAAAADRMKRTEVRAPIDGVVNRIAVNTVGGVIKPGENLVELTPVGSAVVVEARALPRDRGNLRKGLNASLRLSAYDASELGLLKGEVTDVSADSIPDAHGEAYYQVTLLIKDVPQTYAGRSMVPGMTATADIVTDQRTVLSYLSSPLHKFTHTMFRDPR